MHTQEAKAVRTDNALASNGLCAPVKGDERSRQLAGDQHGACLRALGPGNRSWHAIYSRVLDGVPASTLKVHGWLIQPRIAWNEAHEKRR